MPDTPDAVRLVLRDALAEVYAGADLADVDALLDQMTDRDLKVAALAESDRAEVTRLREALVELDDDCCYEIEERRCCSEQYPLPFSDWCVRCIAHGALADRSEHLPTEGADV